MPIARYADCLAQGIQPPAVMTPDKVAQLLVELAEESLAIARCAGQTATANQEECARFASDSQALIYITQIWRHKVMAAIEKRILLQHGGLEHRELFLSHLDESIAAYRPLVALTDQTYINATDMLMRLNWHNGLASFLADAQQQQAWLRRFDASRQPGVVWIETEDMDGNWKRCRSLRSVHIGWLPMELGVSHATICRDMARLQRGDWQEDETRRTTPTMAPPDKHAEVKAKAVEAGAAHSPPADTVVVRAEHVASRSEPHSHPVQVPTWLPAPRNSLNNRYPRGVAGRSGIRADGSRVT